MLRISAMFVRCYQSTLGVWTECIFFLIKPKPVQHKHKARYYLAVRSHQPMQSTNWQTNKQLAKYPKRLLQHKVCSGPFLPWRNTQTSWSKSQHKHINGFFTFIFGCLQCSCLSAFQWIWLEYNTFFKGRSTNHCCHRAIICLIVSHPILSPQISGDAC